jgi:uncharacterized protein YbaP (TraB family)
MTKILTTIFIFFFFSSFAQNTLLWKITGNNLEKPSYLYGTMHLSDSRLFNLGDSLYKAIESSAGFALEVDPNEMMAYLVGFVQKQLESGTPIRQVMNENDFNRYSKALAKKIGKPADEITTYDIFQEKYKWVDESFRAGSMNTFLDAYLCDIARRQGKWIGGVEDIQDQADLVDHLVDESDIIQIAAGDAEDAKLKLQNLIEIYADQNLAAIDSMMNFEDSTFYNALIIKRNKKMVRSIDSLSKLRSMVYAVGAAHLPGKHGIIELMRMAGYEMSPVYSSKKIKPEEYVIKEVAIPWVKVQDKNGYYEVEMPGNPGDLNMYGIIQMKMYVDLFNSICFFTAGITTPLGEDETIDRTELAAQNLFNLKNLNKAKHVTVNGIEGSELETSDDTGYKHGYFFHHNNVMYMAVAVAVKKDDKIETSIDRFLSSYKILEKDTSGNEGAYHYVNKLLAYEITLPGKPESINSQINQSADPTIRSELMAVADPLSGAFMFFGVNQSTPGYFLLNDSTVVTALLQNVRLKIDSVIYDTIYYKNNHRVAEIEGRMKEANLHMRSYYEMRGNRWYALVAVFDTTKADIAIDKFFSSFLLLDYPPVNWSMRTSGDQLLTAWGPDTVQLIRQEDYGMMTSVYVMYDSSSADNYVVTADTLNRYYWELTDSAFWDTRTTSLVMYNDTLLSEKSVRNGDAEGRELLIQEKGSSYLQRLRILLYGNIVYTMYTSQSPEYVFSNNTNRFFEDFRLMQPAAASFVLMSKARELLADISSPDSAIRDEARDALLSATFAESDLPVLHEAFLKQYPVDSLRSNTLNDILAEKIIDGNHDSSLEMAIKAYPEVNEPELKNLLLDIISGFKTEKNYTDLKNLVMKMPPGKEFSYKFISNLSDSGQLTAGILFPEVLELLSDSLYRLKILLLSRALLDSSLLSIDVFRPYEQSLIMAAESYYNRSLSAGEYYYYYSYYPLLDVIAKFNSKGSNDMLNRWISIESPDLQLRCIELLLQNKQPVSTRLLEELAAEKEFRTDLFDILKKGGNEKLFPKKYLTQKYFAESLVYYAATDDYSPDKISYITDKGILFKNRESRFYFFKVTYEYEEEDPSHYLVGAGPFNPDGKTVSTGEATASFFDGEYDAGNLQMQLNSLIADMEAWYEYNAEQ